MYWILQLSVTSKCVSKEETFTGQETMNYIVRKLEEILDSLLTYM